MTVTIVHSQKPGDPQLPQLLQQAVDAHQQGQLDIAAPLYRRFLAENISHPTALQLLGLLHSQRGEYETAIQLMQESLRHFPEQAEVANNLGNALSGCGRLDEAMASFNRAVEIYPRYADAWRNLGICQIQRGDYQAAAIAFKRCLEIRPRDPGAWLGLGNVMRQQQDLEQAINCYDKALKIDPDYAEAHYNLGICLRIKQRTTEALTHFQTARRFGLDRAELFQNLGSAYIDTGEINSAIDAYREAIRRNPEDLISHRNLNALLWEQEIQDEHLESYKTALIRKPASEQLINAYAIALNQIQSYTDAETVLTRGLHYAPDSVELKSQLAYTLEHLQQWERALQLHAEAVAGTGSTVTHRISYVRALLACRRPDEALPIAEAAVRQAPFDQRNIAYLGLCWRMLEDEQDNILNDYDAFVQAYDIPVPAGYSNAEKFNEKLALLLDTLHVGKRHPPEQTLRGGTQTHGDLFNLQEQLITDLVASLKLCIQDYIEQFPPGTSHPLFMRRGKDFEFSASWSVRLQRSGYHTMHIHPMGWISSAYYVQVPGDISNAADNGGVIKFGEPDIDIDSYGEARRIIQPSMGKLVLFPSYMWHGTVPFESSQPRMTVAFDVVPVH